jgi:hypothetical protein
MADVIPLHPMKWVTPHDGGGRFLPHERTPPKTRELRLSRPVSRLAGREQDALDGVGVMKFAPRARRNGKLRFFRIFKLFTDVKDQVPAPPAYRPMAAQLRRMRWLRRL